MGLMKAGYPDVESMKNGIKLILQCQQQPNGGWAQQATEGVYNKSCMISYPNYKFTFTMKTLVMFAKRYPAEVVLVQFFE
jgi:lanosterol synthase